MESLSESWLQFEVTDTWFLKYHAANLTPEFCDWWVSFYGTPDAYTDDCGEQHEYYVRMAFALLGWLGRGEL